ncbi:MAG: hypothetical protein AAF182_04295 [Pseudomonadota bacterium]
MIPNLCSTNDYIEKHSDTLNTAIIQDRFQPLDIAHELMHIAGRFPHTPYGEEFAMVADKSFYKKLEPLNKTLERSRAASRNWYFSRGNEEVSEPVYRSADMAKSRTIKDWQAIYAATLGIWTREKMSEYYGDGEALKFKKNERRSHALKLQEKSQNYAQSFSFNKNILRQHADKLPLELIHFSKTETKILLYIARTGLAKYAENQHIGDLPKNIEPFRSRVENTLAHLHERVNCNPKISAQEQFLELTNA